ncbi:MAG: transcriptional regulator NrdR [Synergistaceae bacterium]|jgi:transcriptional repressor NrdR|nr:transcriptional regulator NrdR [Synergistaceae bacterium]
MYCPICGASDTRVIETRSVNEGKANRRRRECPICQGRFTTYERLEEKPYLWVAKKSGRREAFDREKLIKGIQRSCEKLPISLEQIEEAVAHIESRLRATGQGEVAAETIGNFVSDELRKINKVAYVRFASVYREFTDIESFTKEVAKLNEDKEPDCNDKGI